MNDSELIAAVLRRAKEPITRTDSARFAPTELFPSATSASIEAAEETLGIALPRMLIRVLSEVGNGGFGPGYGLLGLPGGYTDEDGDTIVSSSMNRRDWATQAVGGTFHWPKQWIVICGWGCAIYTCVDCSSDAATVITCDPSEETENGDEFTFARSHDSLQEWFRDWAEGRSLWDLMYERVPGVMGINPFTKEPIELPKYRLRGPRVRPR